MTISNLYTWATLVGLSVGGALLTLEVWLIVHHSPVEMRVYRQILLQISAQDFLPLIIAPLTQPVSNFIKNIPSPISKTNVQIIYVSKFSHTEMLLGPVGNLPTVWQNVVYSIESWLYLVAVGTLSVEFIYRYLILNK